MKLKTFEEIFSDASIPFDERLDEAVELAKKELKQKSCFREFFRLVSQTGLLPIDINRQL